MTSLCDGNTESPTNLPHPSPPAAEFVFSLLLSEGRDGFHTVPNKARARTNLSLIDSAYAVQPCAQFGRPWSACAEDRARAFHAGGPDQGRCGNRPYHAKRVRGEGAQTAVCRGTRSLT
jgi:hypothetical protein